MLNSLSVILSRKRWTKRLTKPWMPKMAHKKIFNRMNFHYDPRDMKGPSFHFGHDLEKGFLNYEETSKKELLELIPKEGHFLDVGANIGMYSVYMALNRDDITLNCFEPDNTVYSCLAKNMAQFNDNKVQIFKMGLGEEKEEKTLYKHPLNDGGHSFIEDSNSSESESVQVAVFDELVQQKLVKLPDAIKIDVEGFELHVLRGMRKSIALKRPVLFIESDNVDLSQKGALWQELASYKDEGIYARRPGRDIKMSMDELAKEAALDIQKGKRVNDYFFHF